MSPDIIEDTINQAIETYNAWPNKLMTLLTLSTTQGIDFDTIGKEHLCDFGKFLQCEDMKEHMVDMHYMRIERLHTDLHASIEEIASLIKDKKKSEAASLLEESSPYILKTKDFVAALEKWKKELFD